MDVVCEDDLDEFGTELDDPIQELWQDILHMILESFGSNAAATDRSVGLEDELSSASSPAAIKHRIETKLCDDPRIIAVEIVFSEVDSQAGSALDVELKIQANAGELGVTLLFDGSGNYTGFRR